MWLKLFTLEMAMEEKGENKMEKVQRDGIPSRSNSRPRTPSAPLKGSGSMECVDNEPPSAPP